MHGIIYTFQGAAGGQRLVTEVRSLLADDQYIVGNILYITELYGE